MAAPTAHMGSTYFVPSRPGTILQMRYCHLSFVHMVTVQLAESGAGQATDSTLSLFAEVRTVFLTTDTMRQLTATRLY